MLLVHTSCNNSAAAWLPIVLKSTLFSLTVINTQAHTRVTIEVVQLTHSDKK